MTKFELQYNPETEPERLDQFLSLKSGLPFSRSHWQELIKQNLVYLNGKVVNKSSKLLEQPTLITVDLPEADPEFPVAEPPKFELVFEDQDLLVLNKPAGLVVHPNSLIGTDTLVNQLISYYPKIKQAVLESGNPVSRMRPGIVHRLDKDTSGLMVVAKNRPTLLKLSQQIQEHQVEKTYQVLLFGWLDGERVVDAPLHRIGKDSQNIMRASHHANEGREALTIFTGVQQYYYAPELHKPILHPLETDQLHPKPSPEQKSRSSFSAVTARIITGRTHQIRAHAKFIGHPVLGDRIYGNKPSLILSEKLGLKTQALHSFRLGFCHPTTSEKMSFEKPLSFLTTLPKSC